MDLLKSVNMEDVADTKICITWPCFEDAIEEDREQKAKDDDDKDKPGTKDRKKKRKKKKSAPPNVCEMCRLGPEGAARGKVRRAALWCCTRCCLLCFSALRVLITVVGVVGICLAAFYILSPSGKQKEGTRVMRASLRALGARPFGAQRARVRPPPATTPRDLTDRGDSISEQDTFQPVTTECGPDCPGGKTGCPGGRPDCPGGGPDGSDCGPGCPGSRAACLGRNKDKLTRSLDIEVVAGPFQVVDSSVIVSPHDTSGLDEPGGLADSSAAEDTSGAASPDDHGGPDGARSADGVIDDNDVGGPSSPTADPEGRSDSDIPNDPED